MIWNQGMFKSRPADGRFEKFEKSAFNLNLYFLKKVRSLYITFQGHLSNEIIFLPPGFIRGGNKRAATPVHHNFKNLIITEFVNK